MKKITQQEHFKKRDLFFNECYNFHTGYEYGFHEYQHNKSWDKLPQNGYPAILAFKQVFLILCEMLLHEIMMLNLYFVLFRKNKSNVCGSMFPIKPSITITA